MDKSKRILTAGASLAAAVLLTTGCGAVTAPAASATSPAGAAPTSAVPVAPEVQTALDALIDSGATAAVIDTVGDVSTFFQGLFGGELVSAESVATMQDIGVEGYGLGLLAGGDACGAQPAELVYGQRGNGFGYRVMAFGSPDGDRFVTVGWTGGTFDPAMDELIVPGNNLLVTALASTC